MLFLSMKSLNVSMKFFTPMTKVFSITFLKNEMINFSTLNSRIWETVGTSEGFVGCVHKLKVGRRPIDFIEKRDPLINSLNKVYQCLIRSPSYLLSTTPIYTFYDPEEEVGEPPAEQMSKTMISFEPAEPHSSDSRNQIHNRNHKSSDPEAVVAPSETEPRKNSCSRNPCQNHGQCWSDKGTTHGFKCVCHPEFSGKICESRTSGIKETGAMLDFRGFSYLELPKIENGARIVSIELWVMIRSQHGVILYNGQEAGKGDYVAITVTNSHVQFLFDLGSGMANLT
jgi:hypothetical protein